MLPCLMKATVSPATAHVRTSQDMVADKMTTPAALASLLLVPHPSMTQLEALVSSGSVLKGRLDVFEHNPREGVVVVSAAQGGGTGSEGGRGGGGILGEWIDSSGSAKVAVFCTSDETKPAVFFFFQDVRFRSVYNALYATEQI